MKKLLLLLLAAGSFFACSKDPKAKLSVTTIDAKNVYATGVSLGGRYTENGLKVTEYGVICSENKDFSSLIWSEGRNPDIDKPVSGNFTVQVNNLKPGTKYYYKAYAINAEGTSYGKALSFTTKTATASVHTHGVTNISQTGANVPCNVFFSGGEEVTERGVIWTTANGDFQMGGSGITKVKAATTGEGDYSVTLSSLSINTTYYVRAYAINKKGTSYGVIQTFKTLSDKGEPGAVTIESITISAAVAKGSVGVPAGITITDKGFVYATTDNPIVGGNGVTKLAAAGSNEAFTANLSSLQANTTYYIRVYSTGSVGTTYGAVETFTTPTDKVTVTTIDITDITKSSANVQVELSNTVSAGVTITERGVLYATVNNPEVGGTSVLKEIYTGTGGTATIAIPTLQTNTTYYVRAYAITNGSTANYGDVKTFKTLAENIQINTLTFSSIAQTTATVSGSVSSVDGGAILEKGIVYSTGPNPTIANTKVTISNNTFNIALSSLANNTTYYVRGYAKNADNVISYGNEASFTTLNFFTDGKGTVTAPYQITTAQQLNKVRDFPGNSFILMNDISLSPYSTGAGWVPIATFNGTFNGNGKVIRDLYIYTSTGYAGIFREVRNAKIENLGFENVNVKGANSVGALVGTISSSIVTKCYVKGSVEGTGDYVGGLIGYCSSLTISDCYTTCTVKGKESVGGIVGGAMYTNTYGCFTSGNVTGYAGVGGIIGWLMESGGVTNCYTTGIITGTSTVGGISGSGIAITSCYATGKVYGNSYSGGIAAYGVVKNCFALNSLLSGTYCPSRISAETNSASFVNNYAFRLMLLQTGTTTPVSITSTYANSAAGQDKTSSDCTLQATYSGGLAWDFSSTWQWGNGSYSLPILRGIPASAQPTSMPGHL